MCELRGIMQISRGHTFYAGHVVVLHWIALTLMQPALILGM